MGEARLKDSLRANVSEQLLGSLLPHNAHEGDGCPKCGLQASQVQTGGFPKGYCAGLIETHPDSHEAPCRMHGEHLHGKCPRCGFEWRERCKDHGADGAQEE